MADLYCDISALGNEYQAYADTPTTWGVAQDGNGKAGPGHAAAVAIATIDCASASASGSGSLSLLGVTVSSTLTGSGATLAANIVTAINAMATAVSATYSQALLPLNRLVWARQNPGLTTQAQIMMRVAGTDWNGDIPVSGGTWSVAPTMGAFAGGANGPFAYLSNGATVFGKTIGNYGLWTLGTAGKTAINQAADVVHCRTRRGGSDLSFQNDFTASFSGTWKACNYLADNGTVWAGDNGRLRAILRNTSGSSVAVSWTVPAAASVIFSSRAYRNLDFEMSVTAGPSGSVYLAQILNSSSSFSAQKCGCIERPDQLSGNRLLRAVMVGASIIGHRADFTGSFMQSRATAIRWLEAGAGSPSLFWKLNGLVHEVVAATATIADTCYLNSAGWTGRIEWCGGEVRDSLGVFSCTNPFYLLSSVTSGEVVCDNVAGVADVSAGWAASPTNKSYLWWNQPEGPNRAFRYEATTHVVDWKGNGTFPHCGVTSLQGDSWSHRVTWHSAPNPVAAVTTNKFAKFFRDTAAAKTLTVQLYTPNATPFYLDELELTVRYIDSSGVQRTEVIGDGAAGQFGASRTALAASAKTWTANGVANYAAKKIVLTTAFAIKQNSEISAHLALKASRGATLTFYVSPEIELS